MSVHSLLASLPAILGLLGFVIYRILQAATSGDEISKRIIDKLRAEAPGRQNEYTGLARKELGHLLQRDQTLREKVSKQDFDLLKQALGQQHVRSLVVYAATGALFVFGIAAFVYTSTRPKPLTITGVVISPAQGQADQQLVDFDTLAVAWQATGTHEDVQVYLENTNTRARSVQRSVSSSGGPVEFRPNEYAPLLSQREFLQWNPIRAVVQSSENVFASNTQKLYVGMTAVAVNFGQRVKLGAMVDNTVLQTYRFEAKLVVPSKTSPADFLTLGGAISNGQRDFDVHDTASYNWAAAKLLYLGPDDSSLVRTEILSD